jgi:hypothetical protein
MPSIISRSIIGRASSSGSPTLAKNPPLPAISENLGKPCAIKKAPTSILIRRGQKLVKVKSLLLV